MWYGKGRWRKGRGHRGGEEGKRKYVMGNNERYEKMNSGDNEKKKEMSGNLRKRKGRRRRNKTEEGKEKQMRKRRNKRETVRKGENAKGLRGIILASFPSLITLITLKWVYEACPSSQTSGRGSVLYRSS